MPTNDIAMATPRWRYIYRRTTRRNRRNSPCTTLTDKKLTYSLPERSKKMAHYLFEIAWYTVTTTHYGQQFSTNRHIPAHRSGGRVIPQPDIPQSHNYQDSNATSASSMQHNRQLIRREQVPWPCFFEEQFQRRLHPTTWTLTDLPLLPKLTKTQLLTLQRLHRT